MRPRCVSKWRRFAWVPPVLAGLILFGCQTFMKGLSDRLTHWNMFGQEALDDPIAAVGGDGVVFVPNSEGQPLSLEQLVAAAPETLVNYYVPISFSMRTSSPAQRYPYPPEYDMIGEAHLRREPTASSSPTSPATHGLRHIQETSIDGHEHVQLTYTAWYPAHPRMKTFDVEEADIDSCVLRVTLDADNAPLFYETIAACGCFHKVFVESTGSRRPPGRLSARRRRARNSAWRRRSRRPSTGRWPAWWTSRATSRAGPWSSSRPASTRSSAWAAPPVCACRPAAEQHPYEMAPTPSCTRSRWTARGEPAPFFDMGNGGKVRGAERKQGKIPHVVRRRGRRRATARQRPNQDALRPEHLGRSDHLRQVSASAARNPVTPLRPLLVAVGTDTSLNASEGLSFASDFRLVSDRQV